MNCTRRQFLATGAILLAGAAGRKGLAQPGGHLTLGTRYAASGLDAHRFSQGRTQAPIAAIYSGLTGIDRTGDVVPGIAEGYKPSQNLMTWTFRLRRGVLYHNGREVEGQSVKQNILRWSGGAGDIERVDILDKYTLRITLKTPDAALPAAMVYGLQAPDAFHQAKHHPIGTGPFKLVSWKRHDETRLARFENYWETDANGAALPYLQAITAHYKPEPESRYTALRSGEVNMVDDLTALQAASMQRDDGARFHLWQVHVGGILLAFNWRDGPFRDRQLRLAAALAIDRETLHQAVFSAQGHILNQPYPPGSPWHMSNLHGLAYDPDQAKALLQQARATGTDVVMITGMGQSAHRQSTELIQQMWNEVGFRVRVDPLMGAQMQKRMRAGTFHAHVRRHPYEADPDHVYRRYYHSESPASHSLSGWYNARYDRLVEAGRATRDRSKRQTLYAEAAQMIERELPSFYLHDVTATVAAVKALQGFEPGRISSLTYVGGGIRTGYLKI